MSRLSGLLAERHRVVAVDASLTQLRLAQRAAPNAVLVQADMTRLSVRTGRVDAVASFFALGHVPAERHAPLFAAISAWLRPGGLLLTSAPLTHGDSRADTWLGVPMFFGGIGAALPAVWARTRAAVRAREPPVPHRRHVPAAEQRSPPSRVTGDSSSEGIPSGAARGWAGDGV